MTLRGCRLKPGHLFTTPPFQRWDTSERSSMAEVRVLSVVRVILRAAELPYLHTSQRQLIFLSAFAPTSGTTLDSKSGAQRSIRCRRAESFCPVLLGRRVAPEPLDHIEP